LIGTLFIVAVMAWTMLRSERSLELIEKAQEKTSSLVIRDGETLKVNQNDIVVGDLLVIESDKKVRADGILIKANKLRVDESIFLREILENNDKGEELMKPFWDENGAPNSMAQKVRYLKRYGVGSSVQKTTYL
jgi:hypothetical protein